MASYESLRPHHVTQQGGWGVQGAAVGAGVLCARGNLVLFADADGATAITGLDALEAALSVLTDTLSPLPITDHVGNLGFVVGSRAHLQQQVRVLSRTVLTPRDYRFKAEP